MTAREQLIAYLATLGALMVVFLGALMISAGHPEVLGKLEVFGLGTITGGLIGILRIPASRSVSIDQPPDKPVPVQDREA